MKKTPTTFFQEPVYQRPSIGETVLVLKLCMYAYVVSVCIFKENGFSETVRSTEDFWKFEAKYNIEL